MNKVRVLLADDHAGILASVQSVLDGEFEVVGAVANGRDAVEQVKCLDPDVLVIDICMPILDGLRAASQLGSDCRTKVVFLTLHQDQAFVAAAFSAGGSAYVLKSELARDLIPAIREALRGSKFISQSTTP